MRASVLVLVAAIGLLLGSGNADAEKVRTNQSTKLHARPGEQAKVLLTVKSGQNMTLLSKDGRWLKVRVSGRTGYVPRSKVDMADDGGIARNTRRRPFVDGRGTKRGFGGESAPDDRVAADATEDTGGGGAEDDEDEEAAPRPKKVTTKPTPKVAAKSRDASEEDEEAEDEEDETPPAKTPTKPAPTKPAPTKPAPAKPAPAKVAAKVAAKAAPTKGGDDDEEEEEEDDDVGASDDKGGDDGDDGDDEDAAPAKSGSDDDAPAKGETEKRKRARVSKKVAAFEEPDSESTESFVVNPTDLLFPVKSKGDWTYVENAEGDGGWIESDLLELESVGGGSSGGRVIDIRVRGGITIIQQGMRTAGSNVLEVPDNYNIGTSSMTLAIGAGIVIPRGKLLLGGEFTYDYAKTLGGGVPYDPDGPDPMPSVNIGLTLHNINVRGLLGIDLKKQNGMAIFGRLGYRYQGFLVADVTDFAKNPARLPSEVVKAPTLGAALSIPRLTDKIGIRFSLDSILFAASVKQTVGLEDGTSPSVKAIVLGTGFTYRLGSIDILASYDLNYMGIAFGAPKADSMRNHMGTSVSRTDIFHMLTFGVGKPF